MSVTVTLPVAYAPGSPNRVCAINSETIEEEVDFGQQDEIDCLEGNVCRRLNGRVRDFRLLLQDSGLILQGYAFTYYAKQLAQHAIIEATQLPILANDIEVESNFATPAILVDV